LYLKKSVTLDQIVQQFTRDIAEDLRQHDYILADTRVQGVSLYDHLRLTAGFAATMVCELRNRGLNGTDICGREIEEDELLPLARLCGWLHDIGKKPPDFRQHIQQSAEYSKSWLSRQGVKEPYLSLITEAVSRHHLHYYPRTKLEKILCLADIYASAGDRPELKETYLEAQQPVETLERELFKGDKPVCLLLGDVDAIKDFVYEGAKLTEIRGGSILLSEIDGENGKIVEMFQEFQEALIYCGGGSFLAIVPASEAEKWKKRIEKLYLELTKTATVTVVVSRPLGYAEIGRGLPLGNLGSVEQLKVGGFAGDLVFSHFDASNVEKRMERKNFGELVADLVARLRVAKLEKEYSPFFPALPVQRRCQSCGKRAAEKLEQITGEWLCSICFQKREKGRKGRSEFFRKFEDWIRKTGIELGEEPENFDALAGPDGRIAFIHADGNNMGDLLQMAKSPAQYRHISEALNVSVTEALFSALKTISKENLSKTLPFEIVAVGGDEAIVVVQARYGWSVALKLLEGFETCNQINKLEEELSGKRKITLSAGVLFADVKYPARYMYSMVEGLLKEAKRFSRQSGGESALCHLWLRSPSVSENARNTLDELYRREVRGEVRYLTSRPFTLKQAKRLTELARELRSLPSHQRRIIAEALEKGVWTSLNIALYQVQRSKRGELLQTFKELGKLIQEKNFQDGFFFWQRLEGEWRTALLDALELIELNCVGS
jgi:CRISPR/Cas system-associated protein Cas10 (large subunit of type III CRISPR-Cas system)